MQLAEFGEPIAYEIAYDLIDESPSLHELQHRSVVVARKLRALGIIVLLTRADVARFRGNLAAAAEIRRDYLLAARRATSAAERGRDFAAGRVTGLCDALAAGQLDLAREIARLSPTQWRPDCEYEDDHCWGRVLQGLADGPAAPFSQAPALLARLESSLQGQTSARLASAVALVRRDPVGFAIAFEQLLQERALEIDERVEAGEMDDAVVVSERRVFIEGLALLALADWWGFPTDREYLYCPSMARALLVST